MKNTYGYEIENNKKEVSNMNNLKTVINTPLEDMDNKAIVLDNGDFYGFDNWLGVQNKGRYYGFIVYRTKGGSIASGQGTSDKGYASKENALKAARIDFEKDAKEFFGNVWQLANGLIQLRQQEKRK